MTLVNEAVERIFAERKDFIIIGLTGRTGCGCTTVAKFLTKKFDVLQSPEATSITTIAARQNKILYEYAKETWESFHLIEMKHIIFTFVLEEDFKEFIKFINKFPEGKSQNLDKFENDFNNLHKNIIYWKEIITNQAEKGENVPGDDALYNLYFEKIPNFYKGFQEAIQRSLYTKLLQIIGDNIRSSGTAYKSDIDPACILKLAQRVNILIKILRRRNIAEKKRVLVVIDAFRNPYEATFFKERYSAFYLFAINTTDEERRRRLFAANMQAADIEALDLREYPSLDNSIHDFYKINIEKTVEIADVHIHNPNSEDKTFSETKRQLVRYISLIMHPGLVPPTEVERCMQVAYDSKLKSGCLSRQVGAVISDSEYNIIATGWNSVPVNQVPCNLRSLFSIIRDDKEDLLGMSVFERTESEFKKFVKSKTSKIEFELLKGRNCSYCFKDAYNAFKGQKNQVHTRSIHAEEMAFLQAARSGTPSVKGGFLFTTASPCELCSKKACHTGIARIYYVDQYPGISYKHVLSCGEEIPEMIPFHGAIGRAYTQLYTQILPYKDELYMLLGLTFEP